MYNLYASIAATVGITVLILLPGYSYTPDCCLSPDVQKVTCLKGCMFLLYNIFLRISLW